MIRRDWSQNHGGDVNQVFKNTKISLFKDVPGGFPRSDLLGVTVALIHVAAQQFLAV